MRRVRRRHPERFSSHAFPSVGSRMCESALGDSTGFSEIVRVDVLTIVVLDAGARTADLGLRVGHAPRASPFGTLTSVRHQRWHHADAPRRPSARSCSCRHSRVALPALPTTSTRWKSSAPRSRRLGQWQSPLLGVRYTTLQLHPRRLPGECSRLISSVTRPTSAFADRSGSSACMTHLQPIGHRRRLDCNLVSFTPLHRHFHLAVSPSSPDAEVGPAQLADNRPAQLLNTDARCHFPRHPLTIHWNPFDSAGVPRPRHRRLRAGRAHVRKNLGPQ